MTDLDRGIKKTLVKVEGILIEKKPRKFKKVRVKCQSRDKKVRRDLGKVV